ncbi:MAG: pentapeptide repeat-containing protein [Cyanobacterium sp. T60_A2020_053]|nr:pentapeptide repeat-containing protein [Cyanobacterium sp. T60_A2020_053]
MVIGNIDIKNYYNLGERDFPKQQLRRIDLRGAKLRGINLQGSDLSYADLRDIDLSNADLRNCYFNEANLTGANLTGANLTGAYFIKAYLIKANLRKAIVKEAYLTGSFVTRADFSKADLCGAFLNGAHLSGANFRSAVYDSATRFDRGFEPEKLGMAIVSSFEGAMSHKVTIGDVISNLENIASITSRYLGGTITAKNFEQSRPEVEWLQGFTMDKNSKITFSGSSNQQATMIQLKWLEKWTNSFVKKCSIIVQDLPNIIEDKHLTIQSLLKKQVV